MAVIDEKWEECGRVRVGCDADVPARKERIVLLNKASTHILNM